MITKMRIKFRWSYLWVEFDRSSWLIDKNAISHEVDMALGCHEDVGQVTSLCLIHQVAKLHICSPAVWSCFYATNCMEILTGHVRTAVVPSQEPVNAACQDLLNIHCNIQWLVSFWKWHICGKTVSIDDKNDKYNDILRGYMKAEWCDV